VSEIKDGGPAFPASPMDCNGMSLRDYFAAQALTALLGTRPWDEQPTALYFAEVAYDVADAMLKAREQQ
jgi:hypothetical protein